MVVSNALQPPCIFGNSKAYLDGNSKDYLDGNSKDYLDGNLKDGAGGRKTGIAGLEFEAGHGYEWLTQALCLSSHFLSGQDEWVSGGGWR